MRFAHQARADTVDSVHVDEAFDALVKFGLKRLVWWRRPQFKITVGAFLIGAALACPDLMPLVIKNNPELEWSVTVALFIVFSLLSIWFNIWGWYQGRL